MKTSCHFNFKACKLNFVFRCNVKCELSENRDLNTFPQMQTANTPVSTGFTSDEIQQRESKWKFQIENLLQKTPNNNPPMMKPVKNENVSTLSPNDLSTREAKWKSMIQNLQHVDYSNSISNK